ncbi:MAG: bifunctional (p)ppGpp synthetase/guanosine-3',5'-bis(diphosphate) 3'-pyrophosphohydrolase, partial [Thermodesulfovibrionales bacterium]|nr:bifunctional (p)ppGpp synthetase/guanosine-3',5'-bis(diphosphate) 3'-pyrophosphohydrolase [Thermodesulfovibrionales bacterium]
AENFRKMLLSMYEDIRVILIKFADRLHNMRTLEHLPDAKRQRISQETLDIYAPLSNRLGIGWMKAEFEDTSFRYLMPALYKDISRKVKKKRSEHKGYVKALTATIQQKINEAEVPGTVSGRVKHFYGIYHKMQSQGIPFEQVHDVLGLRIITDTKANCYAILGLVHAAFKPVPGKFKDYIGVPKSNMYRSLHTTIIGPGGERVEFQIRTEDMDRIAEEGIASHWKYKEKSGFKERDQRYISWLRDLVQSHQDEATDARAFLEAVKSEVVPEVIYVFTPQGDIKELPEDSTTVDMAYAIHTEVGHRCVGVRVDGKMVPLRHRLQSGNTVEVLTSKTHKPSRDWLKFVVTQRAKSRIKQWLKIEERKQSMELGTKLLEDELKKNRLPASLLKSEDMIKVLESYKLKDMDDLFAAMGYGKISSLQVMNRLQPDRVVKEEKPARPKKRLEEHKGITIRGVDEVLYHTAKCCYPVPGDELMGFITRGKGVAVHRSDCHNLDRLSTDAARLIEVDWKRDEEHNAYARIVVDTADKPGIITTISSVISAEDINISHMEANTSNQERSARITFVLEVKDRKQLNAIVRTITQSDGVIRVRRY